MWILEWIQVGAFHFSCQGARCQNQNGTEMKGNGGEMKSKAMAIQHNTKTVWSLAVPVFKYTEQVGPCGGGGIVFPPH